MKMKPCPLCGGNNTVLIKKMTAEVQDDGREIVTAASFAVMCKRCLTIGAIKSARMGAQTEKQLKKRAVTAWNTRAKGKRDE